MTDDTRDRETIPPESVPHIDVGAVVVANAIREQLAPFLERQEARDERMMKMLESILNETNDHALRIGRLEGRLSQIEAGCVMHRGAEG